MFNSTQQTLTAYISDINNLSSMFMFIINIIMFFNQIKATLTDVSVIVGRTKTVKTDIVFLSDGYNV